MGEFRQKQFRLYLIDLLSKGGHTPEDLADAIIETLECNEGVVEKAPTDKYWCMHCRKRSGIVCGCGRVVDPTFPGS